MKKILVVDDSSTFRAIALNELKDDDLEVFEAVDGKHALQLLAVNEFDLVTLDVEMPVLNGYETFQKLRSKEFLENSPYKDSAPPVIFVTGYDTMDERRKGFDFGAADFITKPFVKGELLESAKRFLYPRNRFKELTALVAEDSQPVRMLLTDILNAEGMKVIAAENGKIAFDVFREKINEIDIVLSDLDMPEMDGLELCKKIRFDLNHKGVPIFLLSASTDKNDILELFRSGGTDYLSKPFPKEELLARLNVHLNSLLLNRELNRKVDELKKLGKVRDEFLAVCSHDMRGPIGNIKNIALMIKDGLITGEEVDAFISTIADSSDFLLALINDLLDMGKMDGELELEKKELNLAEIARKSIVSLKEIAASKKIDLRVEIKDDADLMVNGNSVALTRIINNMLTNAVKFTPEDGNIEVSLEPLGDRELQLKVADTGIGIPEDKIPVLFEKYTKSSRLGTGGKKGTGLGLSIVKKLIEKHGGTIRVESELEKGTTFKVVLPRLIPG